LCSRAFSRRRELFGLAAAARRAQRCSDGAVVKAQRESQRRQAVLLHLVHLGPGLQQQGDGCGVAVKRDRRARQRRVAAVVAQVHCGAAAEQQLQ
jgi:hypothetical protein